MKDRVALAIIEDAELHSGLRPGRSLVEATSGNTGIGLAFISAIKGYRMIVTIPTKMSPEKAGVLRALGTTVVRTPTEYDRPDASRSHIGISLSLVRSLPGLTILDQYKNPINPAAHYYGTGREILDQTHGKVEMIVAGGGTGGTLDGSWVGGQARAWRAVCHCWGWSLLGPFCLGPERWPHTKLRGLGTLLFLKFWIPELWITGNKFGTRNRS